MVGESGCGKSTLGRVILGLLDATSGSVLFEGKETIGVSKRQRKDLRKNMQIIFQDPVFLPESPHVRVRADRGAVEGVRRVQDQGGTGQAGG